MIPLPNLNDQSFPDIVMQFIKKTEKYSDNWNDRDLHDPGIMLIELFSYLKERQQERINRVGEKSLHKFLDLLGMSFENTKPATMQAALASELQVSLPTGTKFRFKDVIFETLNRIEILDNAIMEPEESYAFGKPAREGNFFQIRFEKPLPSNLSVNMYIDIFEDYRVKRNPIISAEEFIPTSKIKWEYYGERDSVQGWHPVKVESDETYNLLFSGAFSFHIDGIHTKYDGKYIIRGTLITDLYEISPKILSIWLNSVKLAQQNTKCKAFFFTYDEFSANKMLLDSYLAYNGIYELYLKTEGGWKKADDFGIVCMLKKEGDFFRFATSKREKLFSMFENNSGQENVFKLVIYDKEFYGRRNIGSGNGFANQTVALNYGGNICGEGLEIMVSGKKRNWYEYSLTTNLDNSAPTDWHYVFYEKEQIIMFGDNESGKTPFPGSEIIISSLKTTLGANGNIAEGKLTKPLNESLFPTVSVYRHQNAAGGRNRETIEEVIIRIRKTLNDIQKAVTKSDYEVIAKKTQGLMIENAAALPLYKPKTNEKADNVITVAVEPFSDGKTLTDERYLKNVEYILNKKKLITTQIYVVYPLHLGLEIYCEVSLKERYKNSTLEIGEALERHIKGRALGAVISHGEICAVIESMPFVLYINYLKMEIPMANVKKTGMGDIEIPSHGRVYIKSLNIVE